MKIFYLTALDLARRRRTTNRVADVRFCQSLSWGGADVELVTPYAFRRDNVPRDHIRELYEVEAPLKITILPTPLWEKPPRAVWVSIWSSATLAKYFAEATRRRNALRSTVWGSRDHNAVVAMLAARRVSRSAGPKIFYYVHEVQEHHKRVAWVYRNVDGIVATNSAIVEDLEARFSVPPARTAVTLNPVSPRLYENAPNRDEARASVGLPADARVVVYTGKLGGADFREIELLFQAARRLPEYRFIVTGGSLEKNMQQLSARITALSLTNVEFTGFLPKAEDVRLYQQAADALVSYYTQDEHSVDYNFPQKISEYMASMTPIVTPDYRATRDVLRPENVCFVEPDDPVSLGDGIRKVVEDRAYGRALAQRAFEDGRRTTYPERGREVLDLFERLYRSDASG